MRMRESAAMAAVFSSKSPRRVYESSIIYKSNKIIIEKTKKPPIFSEAAMTKAPLQAQLGQPIQPAKSKSLLFEKHDGFSMDSMAETIGTIRLQEGFRMP